MVKKKKKIVKGLGELHAYQLHRISILYSSMLWFKYYNLQYQEKPHPMCKILQNEKSYPQV